MACNEIRQDDFGTLLEITILESGVARDISGSVVTYLIQKPVSDTLVEKTAAFMTDGTDGRTKYIMESGFLSEVGVYEVQAKVTWDESEFYSELGQFKVHRRLK